MSKQQSSAESAELTVREALAGVVELYEHHTSRSGENMYFPAEEIERRWSLARAALAQPQTASTDLLKRARQFVADSGCDEDDNDVNAARDELLAEIDAALTRPLLSPTDKANGGQS
jgi:hypothetical protein